MNSASLGWSSGPVAALARASSLFVAGGVSLALTLDPYLLRNVSPGSIHAGLPLLMMGASGAFAYGFGFRPANRIACALLHPACAWALLVMGAAFLV